MHHRDEMRSPAGGGEDGYREVFCSACIEIKRVATTERYCPTCGVEFPARPARQQESISSAMARVSALAAEHGLGDLPLPSQPGAASSNRGATREEEEVLEAADVREETMLMLLQRLEQSMLRLSGEGGEDGEAAAGLFGGQPPPRGTPATVVERLPRQTLHKTSSSLLSVQITARAAGGASLRMDSVLADFSLIPEDGFEVSLAVAEPLTAHEPLRGPPDAYKDKAVLTKRGVASFASHALRAERAGARGTIVANHVDVWPYTMKDSKKEVQAGGGLRHFVAMIPRASSEALLEMAAGQGEVHLSFSVSELEEECLICQEPYQEGAELIKLPCNHLYHEECVKRWLRIQHTCPTCRHPLPTQSSDAPILGPEAQRANEQATLDRMFS